MKYTPEEVTQYVKEEDVKFVRMGFCDVYGRHKNVAIQASELPRAFERGVAADASAIDGFGADADILLHPDPSTLIQLPWRPQHGRVAHMFCNITCSDGTPFESDTRGILREAVETAEKLGYAFDFGSEMEFYLLKLDEYGEPTKIPYDRAGYMDVAPADKGENVRREICLTLEQMGIRPERSLHKIGPGQNEIDFRYADSLTAADNAVLFYTMVRTVAAQNGLWADFSPKPFPDEEGSGMHINLSVRNGGVRNGTVRNGTVRNGSSDPLPQIIAGLLELAPDMTAFLNPSENSYKRLGGRRASSMIGWSTGRNYTLRVPDTSGRRVELRSPDALCNPYLACALTIYAGLYGIQKNLPLPAAASPESDCGRRKLPATLRDAVAAASESAFIREHLPPSVIAAYCQRGETRK